MFDPSKKSSNVGLQCKLDLVTQKNSYFIDLSYSGLLYQERCPTCTSNIYVEKLTPIYPPDTFLSHTSDSYSSKNTADVQPKLQ